MSVTLHAVPISSLYSITFPGNNGEEELTIHASSGQGGSERWVEGRR